jgi:uncharacterized membrane protein YfcA
VKLAPAAVVGSVAGAVLLLTTPARAFDIIVPFLVLLATAVLALQPVVQRLVGRPAPRRRQLVLQLLTGLGAVYGGYFGGALGVILVAVLALVLPDRLTRISALKNALSAIVGVANAVVFTLFGPVSWLAVAVLAPATLAGGYLGARVMRRLPAPVLRWTVVVFGTAVGIALLAR